MSNSSIPIMLDQMPIQQIWETIGTQARHGVRGFVDSSLKLTETNDSLHYLFDKLS